MSTIDLEILTVAVPPRVGGMTSWFDQIARGLVGRGWRVRMVAITDRVEIVKDCPFEWVHLPLLPPSGSRIPSIDKWWRWRSAYADWERLNLSAPSLRLSDGTPGVLNLGRQIHERSGIPWAVLMGGNVFDETEGSIFSSMFHRKIHSNLLKAGRIFVDGPDLKTSLENRRIPSDSIAIQYHGIDLDAFGKGKGSLRFFPERSEDEAFRLVWHGRLGENHGPGRFLEIADQIPQSVARMCGGGNPSERLSQILRNPPYRNCHLGYLEKNDLIALLHEGDCGVYPLEGMAGVPTVLLESMAAGLPTLTLRTGACRQLIESGTNGFIVDSMREMVELLMQLRTDPERQGAIGEAARKSIQQSWSMEAVLRQLEESLEELRAQ